VSGWLHAPASLPPDKESPVPIGHEARWVPELVWMQWWREKIPSLPLLGIEPQSSRP